MPFDKRHHDHERDDHDGSGEQPGGDVDHSSEPAKVQSDSTSNGTHARYRAGRRCEICRAFTANYERMRRERIALERARFKLERGQRDAPPPRTFSPLSVG